MYTQSHDTTPSNEASLSSVGHGYFAGGRPKKQQRGGLSMSIFRKPYIYLKRRIEYIQYINRIKFWVDSGLKLGNNVTIMPTAYIDSEYGYLIEIGDNCSLGHNVRIFGHDASTFKFIDQHTILLKTVIHDNVFIGENSIILPGCTVGPNVLIASGSIINKDIPPNSCVAGVPARRYQAFDAFLAKHKEKVATGNVVEYEELHNAEYQKTRRRVLKMIEEDGFAYVHGFVDNEFTVNGDDFK